MALTETLYFHCSTAVPFHIFLPFCFRNSDPLGSGEKRAEDTGRVVESTARHGKYHLIQVPNPNADARCQLIKNMRLINPLDIITAINQNRQGASVYF